MLLTWGHPLENKDLNIYSALTGRLTPSWYTLFALFSLISKVTLMSEQVSATVLRSGLFNAANTQVVLVFLVVLHPIVPPEFLVPHSNNKLISALILQNKTDISGCVIRGLVLVLQSKSRLLQFQLWNQSHVTFLGCFDTFRRFDFKQYYEHKHIHAHTYIYVHMYIVFRTP